MDKRLERICKEVSNWVKTGEFTPDDQEIFKKTLIQGLFDQDEDLINLACDELPENQIESLFAKFGTLSWKKNTQQHIDSLDEVLLDSLLVNQQEEKNKELREVMRNSLIANDISTAMDYLKAKIPKKKAIEFQKFLLSKVDQKNSDELKAFQNNLQNPSLKMSQTFSSFPKQQQINTPPKFQEYDNMQQPNAIPNRNNRNGVNMSQNIKGATHILSKQKSTPQSFPNPFEEDQEYQYPQAEFKFNFKQYHKELISKSKGLPDQNGLRIHWLPKFDLSEDERAQAKVIIVLGQTGSGKTTLLNALVNYILKVEMTDPYRFVLIHEETGKTQEYSQTSEVNQYFIKSFKDSPSFVIVDTPGFGDTRGISQDQKIFLMIADYFNHKINSLHAICFVAQSSNARLTINQKYIFSKIFELFGEDIAENFMCMLTFCDGGQPPILDALKNKKESCFGTIQHLLSDPWYLKFNNSGIYAANDATDPFCRLFWDLCMVSFDKFIRKINTLPCKSLTLTKEVLLERKRLEDTLTMLRPDLDQCLSKKEDIRKTMKTIENNRDQVNSNSNFMIESTVFEHQKVETPPGQHTTLCLVCNRTCHENCAFADDKDKAKCMAMKNNYCVVCVKKCFWDCHKNYPYIIKQVEKKTQVKSEALYRKYTDASSNISKSQQILNGLNEEYLKLTLHCMQLQELIRESVQRLRQIALQKNVLETAEEYIDIMIQSEEQEKKPGYRDRIASLNDLKTQHKFLQEICKGQGVEMDALTFLDQIHQTGGLTQMPNITQNSVATGIFNKFKKHLLGIFQKNK